MPQAPRTFINLQGRATKINNPFQWDEMADLLKSLPGVYDKEARKMVLEKAAGPLVDKAVELAPEADKIGYLYDTPKISGKFKAPKGMGKVKKRINPGNLKENIEILKHGRFKKSPHVFIGPKYSRRFMSGRGANYAHIVEKGSIYHEAQPFMRPAFEQTKEIVFQIAKEEFKKILDTWELKNKK